MEKINYKLELFEGPLDLLLNLIHKNKVDIYDIPISLILEQYLLYIGELRTADMEVAADFIDYTSTLLYIKSRMLLPRLSDEEEDDPRAGLVAALIEYQRAQQIAAYLEELYTGAGERFTREQDVPEAQSIPDDNAYQAGLLYRAFEDIFKRNRKKLPPPVTAFEKITNRTKVTVFERAISLLRKLLRYDRVDFAEVFAACNTRDDIVATFLAVLELIKTHRILVEEHSAQEYTIILRERVRKR